MRLRLNLETWFPFSFRRLSFFDIIPRVFSVLRGNICEGNCCVFSMITTFTSEEDFAHKDGLIKEIGKHPKPHAVRFSGTRS